MVTERPGNCTALLLELLPSPRPVIVPPVVTDPPAGAGFVGGLMALGGLVAGRVGLCGALRAGVPSQMRSERIGVPHVAVSSAGGATGLPPHQTGGRGRRGRGRSRDL